MNQHMTILVTDDDPEMLALASSVLRRAGYEVIETSTGKECLEKVYTNHPDLLLLDVMLPDMSGVDLCRQLKADETLRGIFIILLSGIQISSEYQANGLDVGADGYIIKPISNKELVARIQAMERIKDAEDALRKTKKEQEELIAKLQAALAEIKTLQGLIPICSSCKKIWNDEGFWDQLEAYLSKHTDAVFTHGLCPDCFNKAISEVRGMRK
jgi:DNA-binding response OmpR family regulator